MIIRNAQREKTCWLERLSDIAINKCHLFLLHFICTRIMCRLRFDTIATDVFIFKNKLTLFYVALNDGHNLNWKVQNSARGKIKILFYYNSFYYYIIYNFYSSPKN